MSNSVVRLLLDDSGYNAKIKQASTAFMGFMANIAGANSQYSALTNAIKQSTVAQEVFNAVMAKNPAGAVMAVATFAAGKLMEALSGVSEEQKKAAEVASERAEQERQDNEKIQSSVVDVITKYQLLRNEWQTLSDEHQKAKWLKENKKKFNELGVSVKDVKTAEDIFINNTGKMCNALIARAKAEAYGELYKEKLKEKIQNELNPTVDNGRLYVKQNRFQRDINSEGLAGITADDINWKRETVYKNGVASENTTFGSYKQSGLNKMNALRNKMALAKQAQEDNMLNMLQMNMIANRSTEAQLMNELGLYPAGGSGGGGKGGGKHKPTMGESQLAAWLSAQRKFNAMGATKAQDSGMPSQAWQAYTASMAKDFEEPLSPLQKLNAELKELKDNLEKAPDTATYQLGLKAIADKEKEIAKFKGETDTTQVAKKTSQSWQLAAQSMSNVSNALQSIENPGAKIMGIIGEAIANVAAGFAAASAHEGEKGSVWYWIAATAAGLAAMVSTISAIHSATGYAEGGEVKGNSYSGDNIPIMANAGEIVLTRAMAGNLASSLQNNGLQNLKLTATLKGEIIRLSINHNGLRTGRGEIVQSNSKS